MKLKTFMILIGMAMVGSTILVLVFQTNARKQKLPPPLASQLPAAISNYSKTFKLNTSPPIWEQPQKQGATNGSH